VSEFLADSSDLLRRTPGVLRALLTGLPDSWGQTPDKKDGWRPRDVVGHLVTAELDNYLARAQHILEHGTSAPFEPFDRFAFKGRDDAKSLDELVEWFAELRAENVGKLPELVSEADLDRRGLHPALGEVTMRELLATWTVHDLDHVSQIFAAMAGSRDEAVGTWKTYLGILLRRDDPAAVPG
jgi:DinB superfamily